MESDVPLTESLADAVARVRPLWEEELLPNVLSGENLLVIGHANGLRALISCIQSDIGDDELSILGVPNALPLVYEVTPDGKPVRCAEDRCYVPPLEAYYLGDACRIFNNIDVDGSGGLDAEELATFMLTLEKVEGDMARASFEALDGDRDGLLRGEELEAAAMACGQALLAEADTNGDGVVNFNEYMNWWARRKMMQRGMLEVLCSAE